MPRRIDMLPERLTPSILTEQTRKERRALLTSSVIVSAVLWGGLMPNKLDQLGIAFENPQLLAVKIVLIVVQGFLLAEFTFHGRAEKSDWRRSTALLKRRVMPSLRNMALALDDAVYGCAAPIILERIDELRRSIDSVRPLLTQATERHSDETLEYYADFASQLEAGRCSRNAARNLAYICRAVRHRYFLLQDAPIGTFQATIREIDTPIVVAGHILELVEAAITEKNGPVGYTLLTLPA